MPKRKDESQTEFTIRVMRNSALEEIINSFKENYGGKGKLTIPEIVQHIRDMQDLREE